MLGDEIVVLEGVSDGTHDIARTVYGTQLFVLIIPCFCQIVEPFKVVGMIMDATVPVAVHLSEYAVIDFADEAVHVSQDEQFIVHLEQLHILFLGRLCQIGNACAGIIECHIEYIFYGIRAKCIGACKLLFP